MYGGLIKRMSQTLKEFRLWEGNIFHTKMGKKYILIPILRLLQSGDHCLVTVKGEGVDCYTSERIYKADAGMNAQEPMLHFFLGLNLCYW